MGIGLPPFFIDRRKRSLGVNCFPQKDKSMERVFHTKYWAKNLDQAVEKISGKKIQSKYTPEEIKKIRTNLKFASINGDLKV